MINSFSTLQAAHLTHTSRLSRSQSENDIDGLREKSKPTYQLNAESIRCLVSVVGHANKNFDSSRYFISKQDYQKQPSIYLRITNWLVRKTGYRE
jgi:hypothetical protein